MDTRVDPVVRTDGLKLIFEDGSRFCYRFVRYQASSRGFLGGPATSRVFGEVERGRQAIDFRIRNLTNVRRFRSPQDGLRAVAERAPQAEALAVSWMTKLRPVFARVHTLRRRIATITVTVLAGLLFVHVMLGANGMVVYKQKRAEYK